MLGAAYGSGDVDVWDVSDTNGTMKLLKKIPSLDAPSPNQTASHPHEAVLDPTGRYFLVNDLGTDTILVIDGKNDSFEVTEHVRVPVPGAGPRHGAFYPPIWDNKNKTDPSRAIYYLVAAETKSLLMLYEARYHADRLCLSHIQTVSTYGKGLPPGQQQQRRGRGAPTRPRPRGQRGG